MNRAEIAKRIETTDIVPIVRAPSAEVAASAARGGYWARLFAGERVRRSIRAACRGFEARNRAI